MPNTKEKTDCEVCKQLIKEKHKHDFLWKIACIIFAVLAVVFACLYFGSGGDNGNIIIGDGEVVKGTVEKTDYTPIICISVIAGAILLVGGGIIIANNFKKDN